LKKNKLKIIVTGSNGLIGKEFCNQLKQKKINFKGTDLNFDILKNKFYILLKKYKPNVIIHCASHPGGLSFNFPLKNIEINYIGSVKIIDWCIKNNCKFVFLSSSAVYGNRDKKKKIKETDQLNPETIYGINKLAIEKFIRSYSKIYKFDWLIFRLFATYGAGHKQNDYQGIVNVILSQLKKNNKIIIKGPLKRTRSLIYMKDAVKIMLDIIIKNNNKKIINISSSTHHTIESLIKTIQIILKKKIIIKKQKGTPGDPMHNIANINVMKKLSNTKLDYDLYKGIQEIVDQRNL
jgi:UDP-glucose 4-epimerase